MTIRSIAALGRGVEGGSYVVEWDLVESYRRLMGAPSRVMECALLRKPVEDRVVEEKRLGVPRHGGAVEVTIGCLNTNLGRLRQELSAACAIAFPCLLSAATPEAGESLQEDDKRESSALISNHPSPRCFLHATEAAIRRAVQEAAR